MPLDERLPRAVAELRSSLRGADDVCEQQVVKTRSNVACSALTDWTKRSISPSRTSMSPAYGIQSSPGTRTWRAPGIRSARSADLARAASDRESTRVGA